MDPVSRAATARRAEVGTDRRAEVGTDRRAEVGFTLVEVMMALTVLTIGVLGLVAMQRTTIVANGEAQRFTTANSIAQLWVDRLTADANTWNHPSASGAGTVAGDGGTVVCDPGTDDIVRDTAWLGYTETASNLWVIPVVSSSSTLTVTTDGGATAYTGMADLNGVDTADVTAAAYCTNIRLSYIYQCKTVRAEVRVYWLKRNPPAPGNFASYSLSPPNPCAPLNTLNLASFQQDDSNYHWVYTVATIQQNTAPQ